MCQKEINGDTAKTVTDETDFVKSLQNVLSLCRRQGHETEKYFSMKVWKLKKEQ